MFTKKMVSIMLALIPAFAMAQQIPSLIPAQLSPVTPVPPPPHPPAIPIATTKVAPLAPGALTIKALSDLQGREMATLLAKQLAIDTPNAATAAGTQEAPIKHFAPKPKPSPPSLESVIGPVGREKASFRLGNGERYIVGAGDSIGLWTIKQISNGHVQLESKVNAKKKTVTRKAQWISVGDFLK